MPGKTNPTQSEALTMVCCQVFGNQTTITIAGSQGHFELNVYKPILAYCSAAVDQASWRCREFLSPTIRVIGIQRKRTSHPRTHGAFARCWLPRLPPKIGYDKAAQVAKAAHANGTTLREEALRFGFVSGAEFDRLVQPEKMTRPR